MAGSDDSVRTGRPDTWAQAQSGRCLMNGNVVGVRDNTGLADATVTLLGHPDDARLRSVKLTAKTDDKGKYSLKEIP